MLTRELPPDKTIREIYSLVLKGKVSPQDPVIHYLVEYLKYIYTGKQSG